MVVRKLRLALIAALRIPFFCGFGVGTVLDSMMLNVPSCCVCLVEKGW